jgi:hypothetical protein
MSDAQFGNADSSLTSSEMRRMRIINGVLVLAMGLSLFGLAESTDRYFAWTVTSALTAATLGAMYLAAALREFLDAREPRWSHSRAAMPGVIVFSVLMLITTALHLDRFHFTSPIPTAVFTAWAWTLVYLIVPIALAIAWIRQTRQQRRAHSYAAAQASALMPSWVRALILALVLIQATLGLIMLVAPQVVVPVWPWPLTPLTARALGSWWAGIGVVLGGVALESDIARTRSNFAFLLALGVLQAVALARYSAEFAWGTLSAWLYVAWLVLAVLLGAYGLLSGAALSRHMPTPNQRHSPSM